jgi:hypothetical protein
MLGLNAQLPAALDASLGYPTTHYARGFHSPNFTVPKGGIKSRWLSRFEIASSTTSALKVEFYGFTTHNCQVARTPDGNNSLHKDVLLLVGLRMNVLVVALLLVSSFFMNSVSNSTLVGNE